MELHHQLGRLRRVVSHEICILYNSEPCFFGQNFVEIVAEFEKVGLRFGVEPGNVSERHEADVDERMFELFQE